MGFPLAQKLDTATLAPGEPLVVVNASESEPASRKDQTLLAYRPHLVLDGAAAVAAVLGARQVVVHLHRGSTRSRGFTGPSHCRATDRRPRRPTVAGIDRT